jgi:hypothetical protein
LVLVAPLIIPFVKLLIIFGILLNEWRLLRKEKKKKRRKELDANRAKKEAQEPNGKT